jgi:peroxiredoxin
MRSPVFLVLAAVALTPSAWAEPPSVGKEAPAFSLRDREGALISLGDFAYPAPDKPGRARKVVLLDFFRTDCAPCKKALPKLVDLHRKLAGKPLQVMLLALLEEDEGEEKLERFLKANPVPFLVLVDPYGTAAKKYIADKGGYQIPSLFMIDRGGVLRHRWLGGKAVMVSQLQAQIEELLK